MEEQERAGLAVPPERIGTEVPTGKLGQSRAGWFREFLYRLDEFA